METDQSLPHGPQSPSLAYSSHRTEGACIDLGRGVGGNSGLGGEGGRGGRGVGEIQLWACFDGRFEEGFVGEIGGKEGNLKAGKRGVEGIQNRDWKLQWGIITEIWEFLWILTDFDGFSIEKTVIRPKI